MDTLVDNLGSRLTKTALGIGLVIILFLPALIRLYACACSDLYSHIFLIPVISGYLIFHDRRRLPRPVAASPALAGVLLLIALTAAAAGIMGPRMVADAAPREFLPISVFAFVTAVIGIVAVFLGKSACRTFMFPLFFLYFMVPLPSALLDGLVAFLRDATAAVTFGMLQLAGTPVFKEGLILCLPGLTLEVADACSGIRSTLVLLITAFLAGHMLLRTSSRRILLILAVIPLGILRNSFRILVLALLTTRWDPNIIHGPLHHSGGPVFFVLSLLVFLAILLLLRKSERQRVTNGVRTPGGVS